MRNVRPGQIKFILDGCILCSRDSELNSFRKNKNGRNGNYKICEFKIDHVRLSRFLETFPY